MLCSITSNKGKLLQFQELIPQELQPSKVISERSFTAVNNDVKLIFQCISDNTDYSVWYNSFIPIVDNSLISTCNEPRVILRVSLNNTFDFEIKGLGNFNLGPMQFQLFYQFAPNNVFKLSAGIMCDILDIILPIRYLRPFAPYFTVIQNFIENFDVRPLILTETPGISTPVLNENIEKLISCSYRDSLRGMYIDARIMDVLTEVFTILNANPRTEITLTNDEKERIWSIRQMLTDKLDVHYTIKDLSRMVYINEYKLKRGFQQLTGATIFDYQLNQRIQIAKKWLKETNMTLEEIATATGYHHLSSFIAAFKQKNGITPAAYRKTATS